MSSMQTQPADLLRAQEEGAVEFVNGQLVEKPVSVESSEIELSIGALLRGEAIKTHQARVFPSSLGYRCFSDDPAKFRKPDVSVIHAQRMAGIEPQDGFIHIPPDLAVEVLSPTDLAYDVGEKIDEYLRNGFRLVWVVHPNTRSVVIHRADGSVSVLHEQDEISGEGALPGFCCKVSEFFVKPG